MTQPSEAFINLVVLIGTLAFACLVYSTFLTNMILRKIQGRRARTLAYLFPYYLFSKKGLSDEVLGLRRRLLVVLFLALIFFVVTIALITVGRKDSALFWNQVFSKKEKVTDLFFIYSDPNLPRQHFVKTLRPR